LNTIAISHFARRSKWGALTSEVEPSRPTESRLILSFKKWYDSLREIEKAHTERLRLVLLIPFFAILS